MIYYSLNSSLAVPVLPEAILNLSINLFVYQMPILHIFLKMSVKCYVICTTVSLLQYSGILIRRVFMAFCCHKIMLLIDWWHWWRSLPVMWQVMRNRRTLYEGICHHHPVSNFNPQQSPKSIYLDTLADSGCNGFSIHYATQYLYLTIIWQDKNHIFEKK